MDARFTVRRADAADAEGIGRLYAALLREYGSQMPAAAMAQFVRRMVNESWAAFYCAFDASGQAVGFAGCVLSYSALSQSRALIVNDLYVAPAARRSGIGTALCRAIEAHAREQTCAKLFLETAPEATAAVALYRKMGFEPQPYLAMTKVLSDV